MSEWIETFKGAISASEYDPNAFMNTQAYVSRFDQATWFLLSQVGVTPRSVRERDRRVAVLRQAFQFIKELRGGELVTIKSGFVAVGDKYIRFIHRMEDVETGDLIATCDCTAVEANLKTDKSVPLPKDIAEQAKSHLVTINDAERVGG